MPTPPLFKYYLTNGLGGYYIVDDTTGSVTLTGVKTALNISSKNWDDTGVNWRRMTDYFGAFRSYSVPMGYLKTAAKIIRYLYYSEDYEAYAMFIVERRNDTDYLYSSYYIGEIDFSQIIDTRNSATVNILEAGLPAVLKANESVPVEIPVDDPDAIVVNNDGIKLRNSATFLVMTPLDPAIAISGTHVPSIILGGTEVATNIDVKSLDEGVDFGGMTLFDADAWFYKASTNTPIKFEYDFSLLVQRITAINYSLSGLVVGVFIFDDTGAQIYSNQLVFEPNDFVWHNHLYTLQGDLSLSMNKGDTLYLATFFTPVSEPADFFYNTNPAVKGIIKVSYDSRYPTSDIKGFRYIKFAEKVCKKALGASYGFVSSFLSDTTLPYSSNYDNRPYNTIVTSGAAIRALADAKIKTTITQVRKDLLRWGLGIGIEGNNIVVEKFEYFLKKNTLIATFTNVRNFKIQNANEFIGNIISVGYPTETYDQLNGLEDYSCDQKFKMTVTRVVNTLDWASEYSASPFAIEYARALLFQGKPTTDSQYDNKIFLMEVQDSPISGKYNLYRPLGTVTNLTQADTAYNFGLTPGRTLLRNVPYLKSILNVSTQNIIECTYSGKDTKLETTFASGIVKEAQAIDISTLSGDALFNTRFMEFEATLPRDIKDLIQSQPNGRIDVQEEGVMFGGFLMDITVKDARRNSYTVKLLATPDNDWTPRIRE